MKIRLLTLGGAVESAEELASLEKGRVNRIFFFSLSQTHIAVISASCVVIPERYLSQISFPLRSARLPKGD